MNGLFEQIKQRYAQRIYSFAFYSLRVREDAEDVTQEALLRLWQHWEKVDPQRLPAWVMQVTRNLVVDQARGRRQGRIAEDSEPDDFPAPGNEGDRIEDELLRRIVARNVARLNDPYRTVIILRDIQGRNYREIAEILGVSLDQVKTELFRGRRKLRQLVKQDRCFSMELLTDEVETPSR